MHHRIFIKMRTVWFHLTICWTYIQRMKTIQNISKKCTLFLHGSTVLESYLGLFFFTVNVKV